MLFKKSDEKKAREAQGQAEVERLQALSPQALAVAILPAMGSDAAKGSIRGARVQTISKALLDGFDVPFATNTGVLLIPIREALQRLEHANLVMQMADGVDNSTYWRITSAGEQSVAAGDTAQLLGGA